MKAQVTITVTRIVDLDDPSYVGETYEERLEEEIRWAKELPKEWMNADSAKQKVVGRILKDSKTNEVVEQYTKSLERKERMLGPYHEKKRKSIDLTIDEHAAMLVLESEIRQIKEFLEDLDYFESM